MGCPTKTITRQCCFVALATAMLWGCSGTKETAAPPATADETLKKYEAEFRPSDYDPDPSGRTRRGGISDSEATDTMSTEMSPPSSLEFVQGFRVQLLATTSIDEANAKKAEAEGIFPGEWIYVEFDPPTYKVRAGNFQSRIEADRFAKLAASHGFQDAWPVPERVYKQPPPPPPRPNPPPGEGK
jgi:hypothetical protein